MEATSCRVNSIKVHAEADQHLCAMSLLKKEQVSARGLSDAHISKALHYLSSDEKS